MEKIMLSEIQQSTVFLMDEIKCLEMKGAVVCTVWLRRLGVTQILIKVI
jgi:hypothetical protein